MAEVDKDNNIDYYKIMTEKLEQCLKSLGCRLIDAEHNLDHREIKGAVKIENNPDDKHDEMNVRREMVNRRIWEDRFDKDTVRHGGDDNEEKTAVKHWYEKPEGRDGMTHSNPKRKYNEACGEEEGQREAGADRPAPEGPRVQAHR